MLVWVSVYVYLHPISELQLNHPAMDPVHQLWLLDICATYPWSTGSFG